MTEEEAFPLGAIPERLKCAICTALARDAWKLPCCDQIVCGSCYDTVPLSTCPICAFSPLEKEKITISTSLRTTIAVFLRHAEKRHKDALAKEAKMQEKSGPQDSSRIGTLHGQDQSVPAAGTVEPAGDMDRVQVITELSNSATQIPLQEQSGANLHQHQQPTFDGLYNSGMSMGFPMMNGLPMGAMHPMMMQSMGFGSYGNNGMSWDTTMMQNFPQQTMNMQAQDIVLPDSASSTGPQLFDHYRGGYRGRYASRGRMAPSRGGRASNHMGNIPVAPVVVEGAPTGPSAMRNGGDSRGRGFGFRGGPHRAQLIARRDNGCVDQAERPAAPSTNTVDVIENSRGRSMTRSVTRDRSRSHSRKPSRSRSRSARRSSGRGKRGSERRRSRQRAVITTESAEPGTVNKSRSLADLIGKLPSEDSPERSSARHGTRNDRSSRRSRRHRSRSRQRSGRSGRSRSKERRHRRSRRDGSAGRTEEGRHKGGRESRAAAAETTNEGKRQQSRSRERGSRKKRSSSRRSGAKYEM